MIKRKGGAVLFSAENSNLLLPAMRKMRETLGGGWHFEISTSSTPIRDAKKFSIRFLVDPALKRPQYFRMEIVEGGILAVASDRAGLFYAALHFASLYRHGATATNGVKVQMGEFEDWPDFPTRGVMLDVSRGRIPRMETLFKLVGLFSELRYNHLQLYFENAFAYPGHETAWQDIDPFTPGQLRALDAYCKEHCIELAANQNSFGHMERWLEKPEYASMAELPQGGAPLPWGGKRRYASALSPSDRRTIPFLESLFDSLLPCFSSELVNIGFDEVFDLCAKSRSVGPKGDERKITCIWLKFLEKVVAIVRSHGKRPMFWADMAHRHRRCVSRLPKDAIALEWGYEADHPFEERTAALQAAGVEFWVSPGTSSWRSIAGRTTNMKENLRSAVRAGLKHGATGFLLTDWGDAGHIQGLCVSYPAFVYGALLSWCAEAYEQVDLADAVAEYVLNRQCAADLLEMGDLYLHCGRLQSNSTALFDILRSEASAALPEGVTPESLQEVLRRLRKLLPIEALKSLPEADAAELQLAWRLLYAASEKWRWRLRPELWRQEREELTATLEKVWNLRARPVDLTWALRKKKDE